MRVTVDRLVTVEQQLIAAQAPTEDSLWYYEIGGAEPVSAPANPAVASVTLGGSAQLGLGYSCRKFDPVAAVTNTLNDIGAGVDNMMNAMTAAASAAIAALPALILQRANPGLYDLFQNALLQAEETMQLATKSCEQMEAEIAQGKNPYADLITLSKGNDWKLQMGIGGNDAVTAKDAVETANGDNGVPVDRWPGRWFGSAGPRVHRRHRQGRLQRQHEPARHCDGTGAAGLNDPAVRGLGDTRPMPETGSWRWWARTS